MHQIDESELSLKKLLDESGSTSEVWKGTYKGETVAVKKLKGYGSEALGRKEAERLVELGAHPNIVGLKGFGANKLIGPSGALRRSSVLLLSYIDGFQLSKLEETRKYPVITRAFWMLGIASALDHVHRRGIVHHDVKLENMMVGHDNKQSVLLDFGFAERESDRSHAKSRRGSPLYMAPEKIIGSLASISCKVDVWAWSICLWELITLEQPFSWVGDCPQLLTDSLKERKAPADLDDPLWQTTELMIAISALLKSCWDYDPSKRPSMAEVCHRLTEILAVALETEEFPQTEKTPPQIEEQTILQMEEQTILQMEEQTILQMEEQTILQIEEQIETPRLEEMIHEQEFHGVDALDSATLAEIFPIREMSQSIVEIVP